MKLGQITYFMIIYNKKLKYEKNFQISPDFSDFQYFPDINPVFYIICSCFKHCNAQIVLADVLTVNLSWWELLRTWQIDFMTNCSNIGEKSAKSRKNRKIGKNGRNWEQLVIFPALLSFYIIVPSFMFLAYFLAIFVTTFMSHISVTLCRKRKLTKKRKIVYLHNRKA